MGACVECDSLDTNLRRADDGHFRKDCDACGHTGGPYTSSYGDDEPKGQTGLGDFG